MVSSTHRYASVFDSAASVARHFAGQYQHLRDQSRRWLNTITYGNLPEWLKDFLANSLYTMAKATWWAEDGRFGEYESFHCPTIHPVHVRDASSSTLCTLFPELELQVMRAYANHQRRDGKVPEFFATGNLDWQSSLSYPAGRALFDNNTKFVLQVYRDMLWTGDEAFMRDLYPAVQRAIFYDMSRDRDGDGLPDHVFVNATTWDLLDCGYLPSFTSVLWLSALQAAEHFAVKMGDTNFATTCRKQFVQAQTSIESKLWNGQYYALYADHDGRRLEACFVDQLYGQFWAHLLGLGHVLTPDRVQQAVAAIIKWNGGDTRFGATDAIFPGFGRFVTPDTRGGQAIWSASTITLAALAVCEGQVEPGLALVQRVYNNLVVGVPGMLWDNPDVVDADTGRPHVDFFSPYLRNGAIWNLLPLLSGWQYDALAKRLRLQFKLPGENIEAPFVTPQAWGTFKLMRSAGKLHLTLHVVDGLLELGSVIFTVVTPADGRWRVARAAGPRVSASRVTRMPDGLEVIFTSACSVSAGEELEVVVADEEP